MAQLRVSLISQKRAKELGYDAIHDTVHEMCKDEARHGCAFKGFAGSLFSVNTDHTKHVVATNNPELDQLSSGLYL